jgi:hypothetical protein
MSLLKDTGLLGVILESYHRQHTGAELNSNGKLLLTSEMVLLTSRLVGVGTFISSHRDVALLFFYWLLPATCPFTDFFLPLLIHITVVITD